LSYHSGLAGKIQGDPGFFSFLGKVGSTILRSVPGPIGTLAGVVLGPGGTTQRALPAPTTIRPTPGFQATFPGAGISLPGGLGVTLSGGSVGFQPPAVRGGGALAIPAAAGMGCPSGWHPNKSSYTLMDGTHIPKGTKCVRNRSRNAANGRALRRAVSRVNSFNTLVKRSRKSLRALSRI